MEVFRPLNSTKQWDSILTLLWPSKCFNSRSRGLLNLLIRALSINFVILYPLKISLDSDTEKLKKSTLRLTFEKCIWVVILTDYSCSFMISPNNSSIKALFSLLVPKDFVKLGIPTHLAAIWYFTVERFVVLCDFLKHILCFMAWFFVFCAFYPPEATIHATPTLIMWIAFLCSCWGARHLFLTLI